MIGAALILLLQTVDPATNAFDLAHVRPIASAPDLCGSGSEIVVCGERPARYRLPLPRDTDSDARMPGDAPDGVAAMTPATPCGIFAGQRRCAKAEAARYGYGGGRDPITFAARLAGKLVDTNGN